MAATNFGSVLKSTAESDVILITQKRMRVSFCLLAWFWLVALAIPSQAQNSEYSRFQNRWKPDQYLNVEHGQIESGPIAPGWFSAMWTIEPVPNADRAYVRIRNRWKPDQYLNVEHGQIESGTIAPGWFSAMWSVVQASGRGVPSVEGGNVEGGNEEYSFEGETYGWYDDGWNGSGWYIVGYEFRNGFGFGGHEGWHSWHHHGSHAHGGHHGEHHGGEDHGGEHHGGEHHGGEGHHPAGTHLGGGHHGGGGRHFGGGGHHFGGGGHHGGGGGHRGGGGGGGHRGGGGGGHHGGGGHGGGRHSDIRLKHDIVMLGRLDNGLGFYRFSYNGSNKAYVGVMAQEVQAVMPEAVIRGSDGYLRVYYDRLGLRMQTWDEWVASGQKIPTTVPSQH